MTLTYIFHSGFVLETGRCILVFDYWMDPAGVMRRFEGCKKRSYVFSSHFHEDHFTKEIFKWRDENHTYILSKDILKRRRALKEDADVWLAKGGTWEDENIKVIATGSNDSGVSWIVEVDGKRIFHAGDLCNWYARFLSEENIPETIMSDEFGLINPIAEEKQFLGELKDIRKITDSFDLVMFPVDGRIGNGYTLGARQFIDSFKVGLFVPMHFVASGFESAWRMEPFCQEKNIPFWSIKEEGESISLIDNLIIRKSSFADIPQMREIFAHARQFMAETGNPNQWTNDYPSEEFLRTDIESGDSYVCIFDNRIVATFLLRGGIDPTYNKIYDGAWMNGAPYATIHRIASNGEVKGIMHTAMQFALQQYNNIRIDTHRDNVVMQNAVKKEGFLYCGIIHCWNDDERLAYQYSKDSILTPRLFLRRWKESDAEALFALASDPNVGPHAGWSVHKSVEESLQVIRDIFSNDCTWAIVSKDSRELIGCMGYYLHGVSNIEIGENDAEVGYWIGKSYWNRGYCTEALQSMIDYCKKEQKFSTLWADFFVDNPASGRVMEKCGFIDTGKINYCSHLLHGEDTPVHIMKLEIKQ